MLSPFKIPTKYVYVFYSDQYSKILNFVIDYGIVASVVKVSGYIFI